jgi:3-oxoacyl-[acyl-carrier protein] reductase
MQAMLLENKNAVIYGGGGAIGGAVARAFAREGAQVFLTGRTLEKLDKVAQDITRAGGKAETAVVDAHDQAAIEQHLDVMVQKAGSVDISFNAIDLAGPQGTPLVEMTQEDFAKPIMNAMHTQFLTATAAGRHMAKKKSGVILAITAQVARKPYLNSGGAVPPACSGTRPARDSRDLAAFVRFTRCPWCGRGAAHPCRKCWGFRRRMGSAHR